MTVSRRELAIQSGAVIAGTALPGWGVAETALEPHPSLSADAVMRLTARRNDYLAMHQANPDAPLGMRWTWAKLADAYRHFLTTGGDWDSYNETCPAIFRGNPFAERRQDERWAEIKAWHAARPELNGRWRMA
ncbi:hypothetical protein [Phenylobacterium sp.]|jgi:hypothetical protein|uniref:hypothetical protein n=1 Tax=Phenylobacterium sp. TaxID=1871053 RepID=UPI002F3E83C7